MTMSLAIAGIAMGTLLTVQATQRETQLKNATTRDAMYMLDMVGGDLGFAGVGVPWGNEAERFGLRMRPVVRVATPQQLAFIGDLPLPNADINGLAALSGLGAGASSSEVVVTSEIALCAPDTGGASYRCNTALNSLFAFPPSEDCSILSTARSCPWSLGKWAPINTVDAPSPGQLLLFAAPDGRWVWRRVEKSGSFPATVVIGEKKGIQLQAGFPNTGLDKLDRAIFLQPAIGATVISTLDRVFYSVETLDGATCTSTDRKCVLVRRHCWGEALNVDSPGFPAAGSPPLLRVNTPAGCSAPEEGTEWETVANNLESFVFRYFDRDDVELTAPLSTSDLARVASIGVDLVIARVVPVTLVTLRHRVERRFFLDAGDGYGEQGRR
ncbi:MAG: hypothetical protein Q8O67_32430 [Deltaproteobacteria bacterium]|nr:hypothetical protein [Deltaproteobacteria bacterium]